MRIHNERLPIPIIECQGEHALSAQRWNLDIAYSSSDSLSAPSPDQKWIELAAFHVITNVERQ